MIKAQYVVFGLSYKPKSLQESDFNLICKQLLDKGGLQS